MNIARHICWQDLQDGGKHPLKPGSFLPHRGERYRDVCIEICLHGLIKTVATGVSLDTAKDGRWKLCAEAMINSRIRIDEQLSAQAQP